ncbi:MAG: flagellar basal body P-ring protein FlgI [Armatimonadota bacterium]|nr:flagellar basal body P-ring protein FlgI [Armatimonadota bacterium]
MGTRRAFSTLTTLLILASGAMASVQSARIKDLATIQGVRSNQLIGYGLVVGLDGTGDSQQTVFTTRSVANLLESYGISVPADKMKVKNVAAVVVTADLPPFAREGTTIDVVVSSIGDARSLQGGTLLQTPLRAANGVVYAVAQGPISIGGMSAGAGGSSVTKNHPTVGRIPGGAIVEKETKTDLAVDGSVNVTFSEADFVTVSRAVAAINAKLGGSYAKAVDANVVSVSVPPEYKDNTVGLIAAIQEVEVDADTVARVVVNERTGTVIIGGQARIDPVVVAHGNLTVEISTETQVSQPAPVSGGQTVVVPQTNVKVTEEKGALAQISGSTVSELVRALNALKVTPRDLIAILQAIKQAGALKAQLELI